MNALACSVFSVALCGSIVPAWAAGDRPSVQAQYQADRQACLLLTDPMARQDCLREAGAVRQEALQGQRAPTPDAAALARNALVRCQAHPAGTERNLCERMVRGEGQVQGDVASGGVLRELTVTVPAPTPADPAR